MISNSNHCQKENFEIIQKFTITAIIKFAVTIIVTTYYSAAITNGLISHKACAVSYRHKKKAAVMSDELGFELSNFIV